MEDYIAGKRAVLEALRSGRTIHKLWIADSARKLVQPIVAEAERQGAVVSFVDRRKLDQLVPGVQHQGVVAQVAAHGYADLEQLFAEAKRKPSYAPPLFVVLDEIEDPHNLGSILRTADCAGADGIIIPKRRAVGLNATVAKTSAGAVEYVPVARVTNIAATIERLKEEGIWVAGADAGAEQEAYDADLRLPLAIVIGNENKGLSRLVKERCDFLIKLPMSGRINSLNASVAASILMYEAVRQRRGLKEHAAIHG
jgi:23S rRNA (guanosine2251-2'-O)-methyltransferase